MLGTRLPGCEPSTIFTKRQVSARVLKTLPLLVDQYLFTYIIVRRYREGVFRTGDTYSNRVPGYPGSRFFPGTQVLGYPGPIVRRVISITRIRAGSDRPWYNPSGRRVVDEQVHLLPVLVHVYLSTINTRHLLLHTTLL